MSAMNAIKHTTIDGERWDQIAYAAYGDPTGYERILAANPQARFFPALPGGITLHVPILSAADRVNPQELPPWKRP